MLIDVLGRDYSLEFHAPADDVCLRDCDGYTDPTSARIVVGKEPINPGDPMTVDCFDVHKKRVIRHELVHAFACESGLDESSWASNEEIVDWIAIQFPKMAAAMKQAGGL